MRSRSDDSGRLVGNSDTILACATSCDWLMEMWPAEKLLFVGSDNVLTLRLAKEELANEVKAWFLGKSEESSRALFC